MSLQVLSHALEALIGDEIAGKGRLLAALERQEQALVSGKADDIETATRAVEAEMAREVDRARRRDAIFARLAAHWKVAASALTLGSIVERLGPAGGRLAELRDELRAALAVVLRKNRRVARVLGVQRSLVHDTLAALLGIPGVDQEPGALFEARG